MIKITDRLFSFPPHLVTSWDQVSSLEGRSYNENEIVITFHMTTGLSIELPPLAKETVNVTFQAYQHYHEQRQLIKIRLKSALAESSTGLPLSLGPLMGVAIPMSILHQAPPTPPSLSQLAQNLRHNPEMKDLPSLPQSLLEKIASTARDLFNEDPAFELPTPHAGCHCMHCQLARAVQCGMEQAGEVVSEQELRFSNWHIHSLSIEHFLVVSTNDPSQCFDVKLKPCIACSCKEPACAHIEAVLRT